MTGSKCLNTGKCFDSGQNRYTDPESTTATVRRSVLRSAFGGLLKPSEKRKVSRRAQRKSRKWNPHRWDSNGGRRKECSNWTLIKLHESSSFKSNFLVYAKKKHKTVGVVTISAEGDMQICSANRPCRWWEGWWLLWSLQGVPCTRLKRLKVPNN